MPTVQNESALGPNSMDMSNVQYKDVSVSYRGSMNAVVERVLLTYNDEDMYLVKVLLAQFRLRVCY